MCPSIGLWLQITLVNQLIENIADGDSYDQYHAQYYPLNITVILRFRPAK